MWNDIISNDGQQWMKLVVENTYLNYDLHLCFSFFLVLFLKKTFSWSFELFFYFELNVEFRGLKLNTVEPHLSGHMFGNPNPILNLKRFSITSKSYHIFNLFIDGVKL